MNYKDRPVPADFAQVAPKHTIYMLRRIYKAGFTTIERWVRESGVEPDRALSPAKGGRSPRIMPEDFAERAAEMSNNALAQHYVAAKDTIARWVKEAGLSANRHFFVTRPKRKKPVPDGFAKAAPIHTREQLKQLYRISHDTLTRWCEEAGVKPKMAPHSNGRIPQFSTPAPDGSLVARAAQHLRRVGFSNVYRADILEAARRAKLPNGGKGIYMVCGRSVPANDLIAMAEKRGFDPRGWAEI